MKIEEELRKLKGHGFYWHIGDTKFDLDKEDISKFYEFYITNDKEGKLSSLSKFFEFKYSFILLYKVFSSSFNPYIPSL